MLIILEFTQIIKKTKCKHFFSKTNYFSNNYSETTTLSYIKLILFCFMKMDFD